MNSDIIFVILLFILLVLFAGDPDLMDAIMYKLTDGKVALPTP